MGFVSCGLGRAAAWLSHYSRGLGHRARLFGEIGVRAPLPYIPWAELLRRTYDVDVLRCPCGGRLRFIAVILDAETASEILDALGLASTPPPISRARSPDFTDPLPADDCPAPPHARGHVCLAPPSVRSSEGFG